MNMQDMIDRDIRTLIGDMQVQLIFARARIAELERMVEEKSETQPVHKYNGAEERAN